MSIDIRLMQPHEVRASADASRLALLMPRADDDAWETARGGWDHGYMGASAWEGDRCVGHVGAFDFTTMVPGGARLATAGLSRVGVLPTHTRRGLLTRMMHMVLTEERRNGKVLAGLLASEVGIYPRFGFGLATEEHRLVIDVPRVGHIAGTAPGSFELVPHADVLAVVDDIYRRVVARPGTIERTPWLLRRYFEKAVSGTGTDVVVVHRSPIGTADGYVHYAVKWHETDGVERLGECEVHELIGGTPAVELALWQYLCNVSLVRTINVDRIGKDLLLRHAVADPRAVKVLGQWDELFLRPLQVGQCLAARTYNAVDNEVTLAVNDHLFPDNDGVWTVSAEGARPTTSAPEVTASVNALGSTLLGGMSWVDQAVLGRATGDTDALRRLDTLFHHHPLPYCGSFF